MKKLVVVFLILVVFVGTAYAMPGITRAGYAACVRKDWAVDMIAFGNAKDTASLRAYVRDQKCVLMKKGIRVTVIDIPGFFGETIGFGYQGFKFWSAKAAVDYGGIRR